MKSNPKPKTYRNAGYLKFIREQGCKLCGREAQAHHVRRSYWNAGTGIKPHDYVTIGLCVEHHHPETEKRVDVAIWIVKYLMKYIISKYGRRELIEGLMEFIESKR